MLLLWGFGAPLRAPGQAFESSNLPVVVVQVAQPIPNEPKVAGHMGVVDNGPGVRNRPTDPFNAYDGPIGIEVRGSSSQSFPKKSYAVETRDALGEGLSVPLLGMPEEEDWVLYGPYSDKTFLRNALIMHLSRRVGRYASRTRFVELVLNGSYQGVYVVMERIKRDPNRVDIARLDPVETTGEDVTGGYILKVDKTDGAQVDGWLSSFPPYPGSPNRPYIQYHYPRPDDIVPEQEAYIQDAVYAFESRMASASYADPTFGYSRYLDPQAAVDFILLVELGKNIDGYRLSTFFHRDKERVGEPQPRFVLGPIWDFNLAFGNADYYNGWRTSGFFIEDYDLNDFFPVPFWFRKLWDEPVFHSMVRARWTGLRAGPLHRDSILSYVDESAGLLREAEARDAAKWGNVGVYVWPNWFVGDTWDEDLDFFRDWITARLAWMDGELLSGVGVDRPALPAPRLELAVYPNPARGAVTVEVAGPAGSTARVELYDLLGRCVRVLADGIRLGEGPAAVRLEAGSVPAGAYVVRARTGDGAASARPLFVTP